MTMRQTRRGHGKGNRGLGIDALGEPVVDPTENVLSLVDVQKEHQKELRAADTKYQDDMRRVADDNRREIAAVKQFYDQKISDILTVQVKTTSELISTQLDKVTTSLSNQINGLTKATSDQITALTATLSERIGQLERFRWEVGGKTSVSDPATADALTKMAIAVQNLTMAKDKTEGQGIGQREVIAWIAATVAVLVAYFKH